MTCDGLGKADWLYDSDLDFHIPCCTQQKGARRCGNGPLVGDGILTGDCGEHRIVDVESA